MPGGRRQASARGRGQRGEEVGHDGPPGLGRLELGAVAAAGQHGQARAGYGIGHAPAGVEERRVLLAHHHQGRDRDRGQLGETVGRVADAQHHGHEHGRRRVTQVAVAALLVGRVLGHLAPVGVGGERTVVGRGHEVGHDVDARARAPSPPPGR